METNLKVTEEEFNASKELLNKPNYKTIRNQLFHYSELIARKGEVPSSRELSLARTKMQEAMFWLEQEINKEIK